MSAGPRPVAALPAVLLVAVALWEVVATRCDATQVPDDAAWAEAAAQVRAGFRAGDLIVFAPEWEDPVGRLHLGDLIPVDVAARMDAARFARIWEVSIRGAHHADTAGLEAVETETHRGVTVRRYERAPAIVLADVRDRMSNILTTGGGRGPAIELAEVGFAPHRCIQIIPNPGQPARITFPQLPLGAELVGYAGLADVFTRRDVRAPGKLDVEIGGKIVASVTPGVDDGWVRFAVPTTPGSADVTFIASAEAAGRQLCFAAEARQ
ncbi:MAG: hypothetical protein IPQ07_02435 [Myxococcales bacterium]|nr:hypothetical protein [Myxococcales bacterium]